MTLTTQEIEQEILKYATKHVGEDNPKIITYEFNFRYKRSTIVKTEQGWVNTTNANRNRKKNEQTIG